MQQIAKPSYKRITFRNLVLIVYLLIGAAVFQLLEKQHQITTGRKYRQTIASFRKRYNITLTDMEYLEQNILHDGQRAEWTYSNAVYFAGTTILTVGYGNLVPRTMQGRVFCIVYAFLGIPIACLALKSIAERIMVAEVYIITSLYKYIRRNERVTAIHFKASILNFFLTVVAILLLAEMAKLKRGEWSYFECIYFTFITFTTIGFGDYIPVYNSSFSEYDIVTMFLGFFVGFAMVSCLLCSLSYAMEEHSRAVIRKARTTMVHQKGRKSRSQTLPSIEVNTPVSSCGVISSDDIEKSAGIKLQRYSDITTGL